MWIVDFHYWQCISEHGLSVPNPGNDTLTEIYNATLALLLKTVP